MLLLGQIVHVTNAGARARGVAGRDLAQVLDSELLQFGLEQEITLETLLGRKIDADAQLLQQADSLRSELRELAPRREADGRLSLQSTIALQELLKEMQTSGQKTAADLRTANAASDVLRSELSSVRLSVQSELDVEHQAREFAKEQLATARAKVSELRAEFKGWGGNQTGSSAPRRSTSRCPKWMALSTRRSFCLRSG